MMDTLKLVTQLKHLANAMGEIKDLFPPDTPGEIDEFESDKVRAATICCEIASFIYYLGEKI